MDTYSALAGTAAWSFATPGPVRPMLDPPAAGGERRTEWQHSCPNYRPLHRHSLISPQRPGRFGQRGELEQAASTDRVVIKDEPQGPRRISAVPKPDCWACRGVRLPRRRCHHRRVHHDRAPSLGPPAARPAALISPQPVVLVHRSFARVSPEIAWSPCRCSTPPTRPLGNGRSDAMESAGLGCVSDVVGDRGHLIQLSGSHGDDEVICLEAYSQPTR